MEITAKELIKRAEECAKKPGAGKELLEILNSLDEIFEQDSELLFGSASLLYSYGALNQKNRFFLLALHTLKMLDEKFPACYQENAQVPRLWGNVLFQLGRALEDLSFLESSLRHFEQAESGFGNRASFYWDWAEALQLVGSHSEEISDFKLAIDKYQKAKSLGCKSSYFLVRFGECLLSYGALQADPDFLEYPLSIFRQVIVENTQPEEVDLSHPFSVAYQQLALCLKLRYTLTHREKDFHAAEKAIQECILVIPQHAELWLEWGELYFYSGWMRKDSMRIEVALEKLSSSKIKSCDPLRAAALLGMSLAAFGYLIEDLKLIKDGQERIEIALEISSHSSQMIYAQGFCFLILGCFFLDAGLLAKAAHIFEKLSAIEARYSLFQTFLYWAEITDTLELAQKGVLEIASLAKAHPQSGLFFNDWGVALFRLELLMTTETELRVEYLEEACLRFKKAWELMGELDTLYNWGSALDHLGEITEEEEHFVGAVELFEKVLEQNLADFRVRARLGISLLHLSELTADHETLVRAIEHLSAAVEIEDDNELIICELGYALLNLSDFMYDETLPENGEHLRREAEKRLLQAAELGSGEACYHLACLYSLTGLYDASLQYLKKAEFYEALPSLDDLKRDEWLNGVKQTAGFQEFLTLRNEYG
ncbi:MAG: hypothetical protein S4CHLAM123_14460 [Chlamydiales bacterium]|nr:hypothetical protein [Chlamydiales bacterium]